MTELAQLFPPKNKKDFSSLAPRPRTLAETGLSQYFLEELVAKHLYDGGVQDLGKLVSRLALTGSILEQILNSLRQNAYIEIRGTVGTTGAFRYALTDKGRTFAKEAFFKSGYLGLAPVPIEQYLRVVEAQSIHDQEISQQKLNATFSGIVINPTLLNQLGPAVHSGRAIFIYGPPGTGKSYIGSRLTRLYSDGILIPEALAVGDTPIQLFDPIIHRLIKNQTAENLTGLEYGHDPRFRLCERPSVIVGGELTLDMLEIHYDASSRQYQAPVQLKANNGVFIVDDLGRQRVAPVDLFNRWIVPLEGKQDFLNLSSGMRFPVPFDVILMFSTNLNPIDLADEAFLRRLGHKIRFGHLHPEEYQAIWKQVCDERGIEYDPGLLQFVLEELHAKRQKPLLPCHPRDLLGMALDQARYLENSNRISTEMMKIAWDSYFISVDDDPGD